MVLISGSNFLHILVKHLCYLGLSSCSCLCMRICVNVIIINEQNNKEENDSKHNKTSSEKHFDNRISVDL